MHHEDSASLFNKDEVAILMWYLKELLEDVLPEDIGLMAPYRKQVGTNCALQLCTSTLPTQKLFKTWIS
jgi:hypothetical protein